mmetsp:Transcript_17303/g.37358  ORF Transcript_17303/g.37358 Transcript_17303/m.37358 type:complete len:584 (+) Transcript_17303:89-1840(+)
MTGEDGDRRQSSHLSYCYCKVLSFPRFIMMLLLLASNTHNVASAFGIHHINGMKLGKQMGGIGSIPFTFVHPMRKSGRNIFQQNLLFAHPDSLTFADDDRALVFDEDPSDEGDHEEDATPIEIINGTADKFIVTKLYNVPLEGFPEASGEEENLASLSSVFSPDDVTRLGLEPQNVTLPAALMLLDPEQYPTQSRARKAIRQRSICISRNQNDTEFTTVSSLKFDELGKVINRIHPGDVIGFQRRRGSDISAPLFDIPILYEDDHMAIVNKPAGIVMYRAQEARGDGARGGHGRDTLLSALPYVLTPSNVTGDINDDDDTQNVPLKQPQPVHRLDRPTSGLMVVAKTKAALVHLSQQFENRKARKTYMAVVNGEPITDENEGSSSEWNTIDYDLEEKSAITKWRVIRKVQSLHAKGGQLTLVELKPKTGRYHQLRRHMAWVCKSPLVGDMTYDDADESAVRLRKRGLFLCSNEIELEHPYYNTPSGRKEWFDMSSGEKIYGDASLREDDDTGMVMIKAMTTLPDKFESFLEGQARAAAKRAGDDEAGVKTNSKGESHCFVCQAQDHWARECPNLTEEQRAELV